jgi:hypothetical protein
MIKFPKGVIGSIMIIIELCIKKDDKNSYLRR